MKSYLSLITSILLVVAVSIAHASWYGPKPDPALDGVLIETTGTVDVLSPKGIKLQATIGSEYPSGSRISTGSDGTTTIMLTNGAIIKLDRGRTYTVGVMSQSAGGQPTILKGLTVAMNEAAKITLPAALVSPTGPAAASPQATPRAHGMVKMGNVGPGALTTVELPPAKTAAPATAKPVSQGIVALYPVGTAIPKVASITFRWHGKLPAKPIVVCVDEGASSIARLDVPSSSASEAAFSWGNLGLKQGGQYSWYLAAKDAKPGRGVSQRFKFSVLSENQQELLARDMARIDETATTPDGRAFMKGQLYYNYGMNREMVDTLLPLWKANKTPALKKLLKLGYAKMGLIDEARKYQ